MSAGRRGVLLSIAFLGLALWLCPGPRAHAQQLKMQPIQPGFRPPDPQVGRHTIWNRELTPEQIREMFAQFGQDDGKKDWFEELLRDAVQEKNPGADPKQVDAAIKKLMSDKEFMNRMIDLAQKQKNRLPNNGNVPPTALKPEDLAKLAKLKPDGPGGDPFKLPDPDKFPKFDPKQMPGFPLDKNGRPVDPGTGKPIDPNNPPKIGPANPNPNAAPKAEPPKALDPNTGKPVEPPNNADGKWKFDPDNPLGAPNDSPDKIAKTKAAEAATALWEKNVGPIDESPAVKRAILDLISDTDAMDALTDSKGNNFFDSLQGGDGDKFGDLMGEGDGKSGWEWPKFDFGWTRGRDLDFDSGSSRSRERSSSSSSSSRSGSSSFDGLGSFDFGGFQVPWLLVLILLAMVAAFVLWWKWGTIVSARPMAGTAGPTPWPIDPRAINTREDVVKAFEFLSVLICGPDAKMWTHSTIAEELAAMAATHGETAVKLARLYELARYAPLDEPLTRAELLEARRLVCDLAGMDE